MALKKLLRLLVIGFITLAGCSGYKPIADSKIDLEPDIHNDEMDEIRAAVLAYQFDHNASGAKKTASVFCIRIGTMTSDPTDDFVKRFESFRPPVVKGSTCSWNESKTFVMDKRTGKPALIFFAGRIFRVDEETAEVDGGYEEGNVSASGNTYIVKKNSFGWVVVSDHMDWIS